MISRKKRKFSEEIFYRREKRLEKNKDGSVAVSVCRGDCCHGLRRTLRSTMIRQPAKLPQLGVEAGRTIVVSLTWCDMSVRSGAGGMWCAEICRFCRSHLESSFNASLPLFWGSNRWRLHDISRYWTIRQKLRHRQRSQRNNVHIAASSDLFPISAFASQ